jgi:hypothetical protein
MRARAGLHTGPSQWLGEDRMNHRKRRLNWHDTERIVWVLGRIAVLIEMFRKAI